LRRGEVGRIDPVNSVAVAFEQFRAMDQATEQGGLSDRGGRADSDDALFGLPKFAEVQKCVDELRFTGTRDVADRLGWLVAWRSPPAICRNNPINFGLNIFIGLGTLLTSVQHPQRVMA